MDQFSACNFFCCRNSFHCILYGGGGGNVKPCVRTKVKFFCASHICTKNVYDFLLFCAILDIFKKWQEKMMTLSRGHMACRGPTDLLKFTPETVVKYTRNLCQLRGDIDFSLRHTDSRRWAKCVWRQVPLNTFGTSYPHDPAFKTYEMSLLINLSLNMLQILDIKFLHRLECHFKIHRKKIHKGQS